MVKVIDPERTVFYFERAALIDRCVREAMDWCHLRGLPPKIIATRLSNPLTEAFFVGEVRRRFRRYTARENTA